MARRRTQAGRFLRGMTFPDNRGKVLNQEASKTKLFAWGWGYHGQLGHPDVPLSNVQSLYHPTPISFDHLVELGQLDNDEMIDVYGCGHFHSLAYTNRGHLLGWGFNEGFQLGDQKAHEADYRAGVVPQPQIISWEGKEKITKLMGSGVVSALLTESGELWTWGKSGRGQLGHSPHDPVALTPRVVPLSQRVTDFVLGWGHGLALTEEKKVYVWGWGGQGQLGLGEDYTNKMEPVELQFLRDKQVLSISAGADCSAAITASGEVYIWGRNEFWDQMKTEFVKTGETRGLNTPTKILLEHSQSHQQQPHVTQIRCGIGHFLAGTTEGRVYAWGLGKDGQLGLGKLRDERHPTQITRFLETGQPIPVKKVDCGRVHSVLVCDGEEEGCGVEVYTTGYGRFGRLGLGDADTRMIPSRVHFEDESLNNRVVTPRVLGVAVGYDFSLALCIV